MRLLALRLQSHWCHWNPALFWRLQSRLRTACQNQPEQKSYRLPFRSALNPKIAPNPEPKFSRPNTFYNVVLININTRCLLVNVNNLTLLLKLSPNLGGNPVAKKSSVSSNKPDGSLLDPETIALCPREPSHTILRQAAYY